MSKRIRTAPNEYGVSLSEVRSRTTTDMIQRNFEFVSCWAFGFRSKCPALQHYHGRARLHLLGTHGTSRTRAELINYSKEFNETERGHIGSGAYFWAYEKAIDYATELAIGWWKLASKNNVYHDDADVSCAVLKVKIEKPDDLNYLDATQDWFIEALYQSIALKSISKDDTPEITAFLIDEIQTEAKTNYFVIKAKVATPPQVAGTQLQAFQKVSKMSNSYIVKKSGLHLISTIEIL